MCPSVKMMFQPLYKRTKQRTHPTFKMCLNCYFNKIKVYLLYQPLRFLYLNIAEDLRQRYNIHTMPAFQYIQCVVCEQNSVRVSVKSRYKIPICQQTKECNREFKKAQRKAQNETHLATLQKNKWYREKYSTQEKNKNQRSRWRANSVGNVKKTQPDAVQRKQTSLL